jgi:hypothetical protein
MAGKDSVSVSFAGPVQLRRNRDCDGCASEEKWGSEKRKNGSSEKDTREAKAEWVWDGRDFL